jgi:hypothetical protein
VGETIAELPEPLTFSSDEELNNEDDSVVFVKMIVNDIYFSRRSENIYIIGSLLSRLVLVC